MSWSPEQSLPTLWGKSSADGAAVPLLQHLLDAAAVAERLWDDVLADSVRWPWDVVTDGRGRELFSLLAGWHDLGKATPGFQAKDADLAARVDAGGLTTRPETRVERWRHELGSGAIVREFLGDVWPKEHIDWFWPLLAGHHGRVPPVADLKPEPAWLRGDERWRAVQRALAHRMLTELGLEPAVPVRLPSRSRQLVLAGHVIMADWIASDEKRFTGHDTAAPSMAGARARASGALASLGLRRGLTPDPTSAPTMLVRRRFGVEARPLQLLVAEAALTHPGLLIVEAPMGEGKTEAALLAVELLSRESGQDGVFVALPTQATSDPMFTRVRRWVDTFADPPPVGLLHGKRAVNREWRDAQQRTSYAAVDEHGMIDPYARAQPHSAPDPGDWFLGTKRGLLQSVAVGTVDQVLHAATRTKHVMLRHAGLAAGVIVVDEVHAYDVYMAQFLHEALRWAGAARVPVVLLSATLPPQARRELVEAYAQGSGPHAPVPEVPPSPGYPAVLSLHAEAGTAQWTSTEPYRPSRPVRVSVLEQAPEEDAAAGRSSPPTRGCSAGLHKARVTVASSPPTRGCSVRREGVEGRAGVVPAHAGVLRPLSVTRSPTTVVPAHAGVLRVAPPAPWRSCCRPRPRGGAPWESGRAGRPPTHLRVRSAGESAPVDALLGLSVPVPTVRACRRRARAGAKRRWSVRVRVMMDPGCVSREAMARLGIVGSAMCAFRRVVIVRIGSPSRYRVKSRGQTTA